VHKVEKAQRKASADLIAAVDGVLDTGAVLARLLDFAVHQEHRPGPPGDSVAHPRSDGARVDSGHDRRRTRAADPYSTMRLTRRPPAPPAPHLGGALRRRTWRDRLTLLVEHRATALFPDHGGLTGPSFRDDSLTAGHPVSHQRAEPNRPL
jgi:hypothetical protein